jgi:ABC-type glycerol-3-phosphate transport system substrate-binding protein
MNRYTRLKTISLIIAACMLSACGIIPTVEPPVPLSSSTPTRGPTRTPTSIPTPTEHVVQGTITLWYSWDDPYAPALLRRIAAFQKLYPEVQFDVLYVPGLDLRSSFEAAAAEGGGPTLLIGPAEWGPPLYDKGWLAEMDPPSDLLNTLNPAGVQAARYKDVLVGLPLHIKGVVLYRNKTIIPKAPASFEELVNLSKAATQGDILGADLDRGFFFSAGHLYGLGGKLMTPDGEPAFNNEKGIAWLNLLSSFDQAGPTEYFTDNDLNLFKAGRVGLIIDGTWNRNDLAEAIGPENLAIDQWPLYGDGTLSGFVQSENIFLTAQAQGEDKSVSQMFAEFLLSPESQNALAEVGYIPVINASPVNPAYTKLDIPDSLVFQAMQAMVDGAAYPVNPELSLYTSPMDIALKSVFYEGVAPAQALQTASDAISEAVSSAHATSTPTP